MIEVGQVGRLPAGKKLFVHAQKGAGFGDTADILTALSDAAQGEASPAQVTATAQLWQTHDCMSQYRGCSAVVTAAARLQCRVLSEAFSYSATPSLYWLVAQPLVRMLQHQLRLHAPAASGYLVD